jgi:hypothetical protein
VLFHKIISTCHKGQGSRTSSERNSCSTFALLFSPGVKSVNTFHTDTQYFNTHYDMSPYLSRFKSIIEIAEISGDIYDRSCSILDAQLFLQPWLLPRRKQCFNYENCFFSLIACLTGYTVSVISTSHCERLCMYVGLRVKCLSLLFDVDEHLNATRNCSKNSRYKILR